MAEIILGLIIIVLIGYHAWSEHQHNLKEAKYIKAIMAKDLPEMVQAEQIEKSEFVEDKPPEFIPVEDADEKLWDKIVKEANK